MTEVIAAPITPRLRLPSPPTRLVGRDDELADACARLQQDEVRLLTLTGPGGAGKTRLALEVAARLAPTFRDGVHFVPLDSVADPDLVAPTIAHALGVTEVGGEAVADTLQQVLQEKNLLLVLDNFEHLLDAAPLVATLLLESPGLKVLVTSRAALRIRAEHELPVPPLALPDPTSLPSLDDLPGYAAVALFVERARAVDPRFALAPENAAAVAGICIRLDGLPLAIELAAAQTRVLSPEALLARLERRLALPDSGPRDLPARQRTLREAIAWSYDLLEPREQRLFRQLSVLAGGFSLEAAEAVTGSVGDGHGHHASSLVERIGSLIDKSLLQRDDPTNGDPRFRMLETIRAYGREALEASGEADAVRHRHADLFLAMAEGTEQKLLGQGQRVWLVRVEREHDNLRAALRWSLRTGRTESALRLAGALWRFWLMRGHLSEARDWLTRALAADAAVDPSIRAKALDGAGLLAGQQHHYRAARPLLEEALAIRRQLADRQGIPGSLSHLGVVAMYQGDHPTARALFEESLAIRRELGDRWGIAISLFNLGLAVLEQGDLETARTHFEESLSIRRSLKDRRGQADTLVGLGVVAVEEAWTPDLRGGSPRAGTERLGHARAHLEEGLAIARGIEYPQGTAAALCLLGRVACDQGDYQEAHARNLECLALRLELGDRRGTAELLENWAGVAAGLGEAARAMQLAGAAASRRAAIGAPAPPIRRAMLERWLAPARSALGEAAAAAWAEGEALTLEHALACARWLGSRVQGLAPRAPAAPSGSEAGGALTRREREVAALVAHGLSNRQIAEQLVITEGTVAVHVGHILNKLGFDSRARVAAWAVEHGLVKPEAQARSSSP